VLREADEVAAVLTTKENREQYRSQQLLLSPRQAYRHWLDAVSACVEAERAFGSETVLRIRRRDLVAAPALTLGRCLDFLGEPFAAPCLWPFHSVGPTAVGPVPAWRDTLGDASAAVRAEAELLSGELLAEGTPSYPRDEAALARLEQAFSVRCRHGLSAVPASQPGRTPPKRARKSARRRRHWSTRQLPIGRVLRLFGPRQPTR
jgi:hypothetical protein